MMLAMNFKSTDLALHTFLIIFVFGFVLFDPKHYSISSSQISYLESYCAKFEQSENVCVLINQIYGIDRTLIRATCE